jgi:RNA polymerase sigma factor (sigma-70 family)
MISGKTGAAGRQLEVLWTSGTLTGLSDAHLLSRFAEARDATGESAFRELISRHGPMVLGVCRQILRHQHDADDAFQATFLVLVRKARSIRVGESLAPWLYTVAYRTAQRARARAVRYRPAEVEPREESVRAASDEPIHFDLRPLLDEELNRLPGKYREPIVLCHLEGKTHEEAARLLHWPVGTVSGRLSRGRELLRSRLQRRGVAVPSGMFAANWLAGTPTAVTAPLLESTVNAAIRFAAAQAVSISVLCLTQGVLRTMLLNKIKTVALAILIAGGLTGGIGVWAYRASEAPGQPAQDGESAPAQKAFIPALAPRFQPQPPFGAGRPAGRGLFVPSSRKNSPNVVDPWNPLPVFRTASILLVESPDRTAWEGMSLETRDSTWQRLQLPPGTTARPIVGTDIVALAIRGKLIDHVAAFNGGWAVQHLLKPVEGEINPVVGPGCALYQAAHDFYAFSAAAGKWGVLHLEGGADAKAAISDSDIEVLQGNQLYVFSLKRGEWSKGVAIYLTPSRPGPEPAAPASVPKGAQ